MTNGLTTSIKNFSRHATQWKIMFADKVVVSGKKLKKMALIETVDNSVLPKSQSLALP